METSYIVVDGHEGWLWTLGLYGVWNYGIFPVVDSAEVRTWARSLGIPIYFLR